MDIAYYLIFGAYILFVIKWEPDTEWADEVNAAQLQASVVRLGGMILLMGLLHGLNVLSLPLIGRVFTLNRQLDEGVLGPTNHGRAPVDGTHRTDGWREPATPHRAE